MKLRADHRTVFELQHGTLGRQVAYFDRADDAADYVALNNEREEALQNLRDVAGKVDQKLAEIQSMAVDPEPIRQYISRLEAQRDGLKGTLERALESKDAVEAQRDAALARVAELEKRLEDRQAALAPGEAGDHPAPAARPVNAYLVFFLYHEPKPMAAATETAREAAEAFFAANRGLAENYGRSVLVIGDRDRTTWSCIRLFGDDAAVFQLDHLGIPKPGQPRIEEYWALQKALAAAEDDQVCGECGGRIGDKE